MKSLLFIFAMCLFQGNSAGAISIIGNSYIEDKSIGFRSPLIGQYDGFNLMPSGLLELVTNIFSRPPGSPIPQIVKVDFLGVSIAFPELIQLNRKQTFDLFAGPGKKWIFLEHRVPCIDVYYLSGVKGINYVAIWGKGKGFTMWAPGLPILENQMREMVERTELLDEACDWN